jgi:hypothetical protein
MREIRPSGSEGGVADNGHPYPYRGPAGSERSSRATKGASPTASRGFLFRAMSESPKSQTTKQEILPIYMVIWY